MSRYEPRASLLPSEGPPSAAIFNRCAQHGDVERRGQGTPPGSSVAAAYLTAQSWHHGCWLWWLRMRIRGGPSARYRQAKRRLGLRSRTHIVPGLHHSIQRASRGNVVRNSTHAGVSKPPPPFPRNPPSLCSTNGQPRGERTMRTRFGWAAAGQSSHPRKMCGRGSARLARGQGTSSLLLAVFPAPSFTTPANQRHYHLQDRDLVSRSRAPIR